MKVLVALVVCACAAVSSGELASPLENTAFDYFRRFGIPEAERIRRAEELQVQNPSRIVGGSPVGENNGARYAGGVLIDLVGISSQAVCGCTIITPERLITAAHCWSDGVNQAWRFTVVLGSLTLFSGGHRDTATAVIPHEQWNAALLRNDIAVIFLPEIPMDSSMAMAVLPSPAQLGETFTGQVVKASGFGVTHDDQTGVTEGQSLNEVYLVVVSNAVCRVAYPLYVTNNIICTGGGGGVGTCSGDSGGPVTLNQNGVHTLIGVASFVSSQGCSSGRPAGHTRVTAHYDWIRRFIETDD